MSKLILILVLLLSLLSTPAYAARGFGTTDGTATTDIITTTATAITSSVSYEAWFWRTGSGGGTFGRIFDKDSLGAGHRRLNDDNAGGLMEFQVTWSLTVGSWTIVRPSGAAWHHIVIVYDGSSTSNNPVIYLDGSSVSVTTVIAPTGTLGSSAQVYNIGNRTAADRNWNGRIAEVAIWENTLLSAGNVTALYNGGLGARADSIPTAPTHYWKLCGTASPEPNEIGGGSSGTVTGTAQQAHPFANCNAPAASPPSQCGALMVLGISC